MAFDRLATGGNGRLLTDEWVTAFEISKRLKVSRPWPYIMVKRGKLPHYKMGKTIRFKWTDIEEYLKGCRIEKKVTDS